VGAGFGWGAEALVANGYANVIGIENCPWIHEEKHNTEDAEISEALANSWLRHYPEYHGRIKKYLLANEPRSKVPILNEDMSTDRSRNNIEHALGGWPDVVVMENIVDRDTTESEIIEITRSIEQFPGHETRVIWIVWRDYPPLTAERIREITGAEVVYH
jgi:hypothetical protein